MQTFARAIVTYVATLLFFVGSVVTWDGSETPLPFSSAIALIAILLGLWSAIPTLLIGAFFWAIIDAFAMPVRWHAVAVSASTALTSMKVSTYFYVEAFHDMGARNEASVAETILLVSLAGAVAFLVWTIAPQEEFSDDR